MYLLKKYGKIFIRFYNAGGKCIWQYIHFDYNEDEIELAKNIAKKLDIELKIRVSWRNTGENNKFKSSEALKIDNNIYDVVEKKQELGDYDQANIICRHQIENEIFVTSEGKVCTMLSFTR